MLAIDGTRLKAVNSKERNFTREKLKTMLTNADARLAEYLAELAKADEQDGSPSVGAPLAKHPAEKIATLQQRCADYAAIEAELERTGASQVSLTDPDSRAMATYPKVGVGYNAQVTVDAKHKFIVEQEVSNAGSDLGQLAPTAILAKEALGVAPSRRQRTVDITRTRISPPAGPRVQPATGQAHRGSQRGGGGLWPALTRPPQGQSMLRGHPGLV